MFRILLYTIIIEFLLIVFNVELVKVNVTRPLSRFERVKSVMTILISSRGYQKYWSQFQIDKTTREILRTERVTGEHVTRILATIELESRFRYWVKSATNLDGTRDLGLTQQNSEYYQYRCKRVLGRQCSFKELFVPWVSVILMRWRLLECRQYSGEDRFLCYNSAKNVGRKSRYQISWLKAYHKVLKLWKTTKIKSKKRL